MTLVAVSLANIGTIIAILMIVAAFVMMLKHAFEPEPEPEPLAPPPPRESEHITEA